MIHVAALARFLWLSTALPAPNLNQKRRKLRTKIGDKDLSDVSAETADRHNSKYDSFLLSIA